MDKHSNRSAIKSKGSGSEERHAAKQAVGKAHPGKCETKHSKMTVPSKSKQ